MRPGETHVQSCLPKREKQPAVTSLFCLSWQHKPHSAERGLWQELHLVPQSRQQKANVRLRERMRKWYRFRINTGNTGALAASYTGKSSLRARGSILWAPKPPLKKGAQWATKSNLRMLSLWNKVLLMKTTLSVCREIRTKRLTDQFLLQLTLC